MRMAQVEQMQPPKVAVPASVRKRGRPPGIYSEEAEQRIRLSQELKDKLACDELLALLIQHHPELWIRKDD